MNKILNKQELTHVSASQIQLFQDCPSKWYITYVLGLKQPSTPSQLLGKKIHSDLENYLEHGIEPPETKSGTIAKRGLALLPNPGDGKVEGYIEIESLPLKLKGFVDLLYTDSDGFHVIHDHKTTKSRRWMKAPHELALNVQMNVYAKWFFDENPDEDRVVLQHLYFGTTGKGFAETVKVNVSRDSVEANWLTIADTVSKMLVCAEQEEEEVTKRLSACDAYGGCPFKSRCWGVNQSPNSKPPLEGDTTMTTRLIDQILKTEDNAKSQTDLQAINPPGEAVIPISEPENSKPAQTPNPAPSAALRKLPHTPVPPGKMGGLLASQKPVTPPRPLRVLFIKSMPSKDHRKAFGKPLHYSDLIAPHVEKICAEYDAPHISLCGQYGDGYKRLASAVAQEGWGSHSSIYINPMRSKGCEHVLDVLVALADIVIEGT